MTTKLNVDAIPDNSVDSSKLVSSSIKTINNTSLLGSGNISLITASDVATTSMSGLMSYTDKGRLDTLHTQYRGFTMPQAYGEVTDNPTPQWMHLLDFSMGTIHESFIVDVYWGDGYNGLAYQNEWWRIFIKRGWQATAGATHTVGVTVHIFGGAKDANSTAKVICSAAGVGQLWLCCSSLYMNGMYRYLLNCDHSTPDITITHVCSFQKDAPSFDGYVEQDLKVSLMADTTDTVAAANKWATARTLSLTGSVTGSATIDGSGNVSLATTTNHTHSYLPLSGGTITKNVFAPLIIERSGSAGFAGIGFQNTNGRLGYISLTGSKDGQFIRTCGSDTNKDYTILDTSSTSVDASTGNFTINSINPVSKMTQGDTIADNTDLLMSYKSGFSTSGYENRVYKKKASLLYDYVSSKISSSGNASTATKLATARTVSGGVLDKWSFTFDGSGNVTASNSMYYCTINSNSKANYPYHRIASINVTGSYADPTLILLISENYTGGGYGIVRVDLRTNNSATAVSSARTYWLVRSNLSADCIQVGLYNVWGATYLDVFFYTTKAYIRTIARVLSSGNGANLSRNYTLYNSYEANDSTTTSKGTDSSECYASIAAAGQEIHGQAYTNDPIVADLGGVVNQANYLVTARTLQVNLASTAAASFNGSANASIGVTGKLPVANGGTGLATLTSGYALIGNGTSAVSLRAISNNTSVGVCGVNPNLMTVNHLAYWNGAYSGTNSNLNYCKSGTIIGSNGGTMSGALTVNALLTASSLSVSGQASVGSLKIGDATISWDSTNSVLTVDKSLYTGGEDNAYGVRWFYGVSPTDPQFTDGQTALLRIGNASYHQTLPVQSLMRGCLLDDDGNVVEYLSGSWLDHDLSGASGQVMVEVPGTWWRFSESAWGAGVDRRALVSLEEFEGAFYVPKFYVGAYEASYDANSKMQSAAGVLPKVSQSLTAFRTAARKRNTANTKWNVLPYLQYKVLFWLYMIEYANRNVQLTFNSARDANGCKQGGLGIGVTNVPSWSAWTEFNNNCPFVVCGTSDSLGDESGDFQKDAADYTNGDKTLTTSDSLVHIPRYRGIENLFGHIYKFIDGIRVYPATDKTVRPVYTMDDPAKFAAGDSSVSGWSNIGNESGTQGFTKKLIFGAKGEIMASVVGGGSSTYWADYHYADGTGLKAVLCGGAHFGSHAGLGVSRSDLAPSHAHASIGSRLCFLP